MRSLSVGGIDVQYLQLSYLRLARCVTSVALKYSVPTSTSKLTTDERSIRHNFLCCASGAQAYVKRDYKRIFITNEYLFVCSLF